MYISFYVQLISNSNGRCLKQIAVAELSGAEYSLIEIRFYNGFYSGRAWDQASITNNIFNKCIAHAAKISLCRQIVMREHCDLGHVRRT